MKTQQESKENEIREMRKEDIREMRSCILKKNPNRVKARALRNGKVKIFTEQEIFFFNLRRLQRNSQ